MLRKLVWILLFTVSSIVPASAFQASISIPNGTGAQVRAAMNNALQAVTTHQSGNSAPSPTYPYMLWTDTSTTPPTLKSRNGANTGWISIGTLNDSGNVFTATNATNATTTVTATNTDTLDGLHSTAFATSAQGTKADNALPASSYTAADVLTKIKTVDGSASGLDADSLDGLNSTYFQPASTAINTSNIASQSVARLTATYGDFQNNLSTLSGYQKLAGGLMIQWKYVSGLPDNTQININYPTAFSNATVYASCQKIGAMNNSGSGEMKVDGLTTDSMYINSGTVAGDVFCLILGF